MLAEADRLALDALADGQWHYVGTRTWRIYARLAATGLVARRWPPAPGVVVGGPTRAGC